MAFLGGSSNSAVGRAHVTALRLSGYFELVGGLFSRKSTDNYKALQDFNLLDSPKLNSIEEFIHWVKTAEIDLIVLLTPTNQHYAHLLMLSDLRIPVLSEKALATSNHQAQEISLIYKNRGTDSYVMYNYTSYPMIREMRAMLKLWKDSSLKFAKLEMPQDAFIKLGEEDRFLHPQDWRQRDYVLPTITLDLGVHLYSLTHFLFAQHLRVEGTLTREKSHGRVEGVIDDVTILTTLENGVPIDLWFSKVSLGNKNGLKISVFGDNESISWLQERPDELVISDAQGRISILRRGDIGLIEANEERYSRFKGGHPTGFVEAMGNYYEDVAIRLHMLNQGSQQTNWNLFTFQDAQRGILFFESTR